MVCHIFFNQVPIALPVANLLALCANRQESPENLDFIERRGEAIFIPDMFPNDKANRGKDRGQAERHCNRDIQHVMMPGNHVERNDRRVQRFLEQDAADRHHRDGHKAGFMPRPEGQRHDGADEHIVVRIAAV